MQIGQVTFSMIFKDFALSLPLKDIPQEKPLPVQKANVLLKIIHGLLSPQFSVTTESFSIAALVQLCINIITFKRETIEVSFKSIINIYLLSFF